MMLVTFCFLFQRSGTDAPVATSQHSPLPPLLRGWSDGLRGDALHEPGLCQVSHGSRVRLGAGPSGGGLCQSPRRRDPSSGLPALQVRHPQVRPVLTHPTHAGNLTTGLFKRRVVARRIFQFRGKVEWTTIRMQPSRPSRYWTLPNQFLFLATQAVFRSMNN